jgi:hypothetical protein
VFSAHDDTGVVGATYVIWVMVLVDMVRVYAYWVPVFFEVLRWLRCWRHLWKCGDGLEGRGGSGVGTGRGARTF